MKFSRICHIVVVFLLGLGATAAAQIDPATSLLLQSNQTDNSGLDSSRYIIKPAAPRAKKPKTPAANTAKQAPEVAKTKPPSIPQKAATPTTAAPTATNAPTSTSTAPTPATPVTPVVIPNEASTPKLPGNAYRSTVKRPRFVEMQGSYYPEDDRINIADITIAPGVFYADSASQYWYRRYFTSGPSVEALANVWVNPNVGIRFRYFTSLGGDIHADPTGARSVLATSSILDAGLSYRKYFSISRRSPSLIVSLSYNEYDLTVGSTEPNRIRLKKSGLDLGFRMNYPVTVSRAWFLTSDLMPRLSDGEQATGVSVTSGDSPSAYAVKIGLGQEFMLDRTNQVFWELSHRYDKVVYSGTANVADPITGTAPQGVAAATGTTIFQIGFTWGN